MKTINLLCCVTLTIFLAGCQRAQPFHAWFWTSKHYSEPHFLYINDTLKGALPYLPKGPQCGDASLKGTTLYVYMPSGRYNLAVKDSAGNLVYRSVWILELSRHHKSINITNKGTFVNSGAHINSEGEEDCIIAEMFY